MRTPHSLALLLADARFPAGGHAHSGGAEEACRRGLIGNVDGLEDHLRGRLQTSGAVAAHTAAAVCAEAGRGRALATLWRTLDAELDARILSPAARSVS
jgi:urease accessory protein